MTLRRWLTLLVPVAVLLLGFPDGTAATWMATRYWKPDTAQIGVDSVPPRRPRALLEHVYRGRNPWRRLPGDSLDEMTAGAEVGTLVLGVESVDDRTPGERLGWRFRVVAGQLPADFDLPGYPILAEQPHEAWTSADRPEYEVSLHWRDWHTGDGGHLAPLHFALLLIALDVAENESAPSDTVWVDDPGR